MAFEWDEVEAVQNAWVQSNGTCWENETQDTCHATVTSYMVGRWGHDGELWRVQPLEQTELEYTDVPQV